MKTQKAETPILTLGGDDDYEDRWGAGWSCSSCVHDHFETSATRITFEFSTKESGGAVPVRVKRTPGAWIVAAQGCHGGYNLLFSPLMKFLDQHFTIPKTGRVVRLYYTVYEY